MIDAIRKGVLERARSLGAFLDFVAFALVAYTMLVATPLGGLAFRALARLLPGHHRTPSLISYFHAPPGMEVASEHPKLPPAAIAAPFVPTRLVRTATAQAALRPALERGLAIMAARGELDSSGALDVRLSETAIEALHAVGLDVPAAAGAQQREALLARGVARLAHRLGSEEAAVAVLSSDLSHVTWALERAKASGADDYRSYDSFRYFLPPADRARTDPLVNGTFALATAYEMARPVAIDARVTSPFGNRTHPMLLTPQFHTGTDYGVPSGTAIQAAASGRVMIAAEDSINGRFVKIDHGHGLTTAYCHASRLEVRREDHVQRGGEIMLSGATGRATGPHLHFQLELDGAPIDPELFLRPPTADPSL
jgi:murein DD-endopeptidase MepM/ murein hydrolase activator NlpD